ncbi:hypothetical protein CBS101457_005191 [Exobasidium rhododendri]|nr:hypothetical protein CBS101457_005191 [Exobasidium rhododendri]
MELVGLCQLTEEGIIKHEQVEEVKDFMDSAPDNSYFKTTFLEGKGKQILLAIYDEKTDEQIDAKVFTCGVGYERFKQEYFQWQQKEEKDDQNAHLATGHCDWEDLEELIESSEG